MGAKVLVEWLEEIDDPRRAGYALRHDLVKILVIAIAGIASEAENFEDVFDWATTKKAWLRRFLVLKHGIPSADTLNRVFRLLDPGQFEAAYQGWVGGIVGAVEGLVAIDGKTVRGSADGLRGGIHLVSAYATRHGLSLGQVKVADKTNEITAILPAVGPRHRGHDRVGAPCRAAGVPARSSSTTKWTICWRSRAASRRCTWPWPALSAGADRRAASGRPRPVGD
ncbi:MAG: ISAs1 family transposase [Azonexus sp.]